jgi:tRNA1(Val) A37 N6-methylase TrmN6
MSRAVDDPAVDRLLDGAVRIRQPPSGHRVGTDAVLLAAAVGAAEGVVVDAGAGVGAAGLMLAARAPRVRLRLVEVDPLAAQFARGNLALNGLEDRADVVEADLLSAKARRAAGLADGGADLVLTNPPWIAPQSARASPDPRRALAHVAAGGLDPWLRAVAAMTRAGGRMAIIVRADDLAALIEGCAGRFGDLAILPVFPREDRPAIRLVAVGVKGSRAAPTVRPGLTLHRADGRFTEAAEAIHRGAATLGL